MTINLVEYDKDGCATYTSNGLYHRVGGPAMERIVIEYDSNNDLEHHVLVKEWWILGKLHRIDGPAVEKHAYGRIYAQWYYKGKKLECNSQEEFERILKLKAFW